MTISPEDLAEQEKTLRFTQFTNEDALMFTNYAVKAAQALDQGPITVQVVLDDITILEFWMTGRDHAGWLKRKVHTVLETGHSSLWAFQHLEEEPYHSWLQDNTQAICGGGFPLIISGRLHGAFAVSGLDHESDHQVLISGLKALLNSHSIYKKNNN